MVAHVSDVWFQVTDLEVASGRGCVVTTTDGTEYLDFSSGIAVTSTGHCHPHVVEAIQAQAAQFIHAQVNVYRHTRLAELAGRLAEIAPPPIDTFFFANSGAEATESAVKLAKQAAGRPNVIVFQGSFHGRTHLAMAMTTSKTVYRAGHAPLPSGVFVAPFPKGDDEVDACLDAVRLLLLSQTAPAETAAMLIEPVLGEGGYVPAPTAFLHGLVEIGAEHGILFIADEVQSGFGRTGTMFCVEQHGIRPDIVVMAKGLASGFPISAVGASAELMAKWPTGSHGGTYGGNPIGCAAAIATIDVLTEPDFLANVEDARRAAAGRPPWSRRGGRRHRGRPRARAHGGQSARRPGPRPARHQALSHRGPPDPDERRHLRRRHPLDATAGGQRGGDRHRPRRLRQGAGRQPLTRR